MRGIEVYRKASLARHTDCGALKRVLVVGFEKSILFILYIPVEISRFTSKLPNLAKYGKYKLHNLAKNYNLWFEFLSFSQYYYMDRKILRGPDYEYQAVLSRQTAGVTARRQGAGFVRAAPFR